METLKDAIHGLSKDLSKCDGWNPTDADIVSKSKKIASTFETNPTLAFRQFCHMANKHKKNYQLFAVLTAYINDALKGEISA